jgi:hypothetical protein
VDPLDPDREEREREPDRDERHERRTSRQRTAPRFHQTSTSSTAGVVTVTVLQSSAAA